jgi:uncharacterized delta-60 repeat protein
MSRRINARTSRSVSGKRCIAFTERLESRQLLSAGDIVPSFGSEGLVSGDLFPGGSASAVAVQADGKVIAGGTTGQVPGGGMVGEFALARFNSNGSLDRTFGVDGRVITNLGISFQGIGAVAVQKDGKIVAAGFSGRDFALVRYLPSGQLDKTFGSNGIQDVPFSGQAAITAIALQPNGKIDVAGSALNTIDQQRFALAQFTTSGQLDPTFGMHGITTTTFPNTGGMADAMVIQPNGDLIVAGGSDAGNATFDFTLARYTPAGKLDTAFGTGGIVVDTSLGAGSFSGVALKSNGQIIADGSDVNSNAVVTRFQSNGKIDRSFGKDGVATITYFGPLVTSAVLMQKSGDIVVVGTAIQPQRDFTDSTFFAARFTPAGAVDNSFGNSLVPGLQEAEIPGGQGTALAGALQANDRIVVVGNSSLGDQGTDFALARYTLSGQPDSSFGFGGVVQSPNGINGDFAADIVQSDGKIIVAGSELALGGEPTDAALVRYNPDGSLDTSFGVDGHVYFHIGSNAIFNALALDAKGDIVAGGTGTDALGNSDFALVRFHSNGTVDTSFGTGGAVLTSFSNSFNTTITNLAIQSNGDIVAAGSTFISSFEVAAARYLPNGKLDPSFGTGGRFLYVDGNADATPNGMALQSDGKILIAGRFNSDFGVLRLLSNGKLDSGFGTGGVVLVKFANELAASANAIAIDSSGDIVVGGSVDISEGDFFNTYYALVRLSHISGKLDSTFGTGGKVTLLLPGDYDDTINSLAIEKDGKIIAGGMTQGPSTGAMNAGVLRFTARGVLDKTFGQDGVAYPAGGNEVGPVVSVIVESNGDILGMAADLFLLTGK